MSAGFVANLIPIISLTVCHCRPLIRNVYIQGKLCWYAKFTKTHRRQAVHCLALIVKSALRLAIETWLRKENKQTMYEKPAFAVGKVNFNHWPWWKLSGSPQESRSCLISVGRQCLSLPGSDCQDLYLRPEGDSVRVLSRDGGSAEKNRQAIYPSTLLGRMGKFWPLFLVQTCVTSHLIEGDWVNIEFIQFSL